MKKLEKILKILEKYGLVNKVIDRLLTPEMAEAFGRGLGDSLKNDRMA